MAKYKVTGSLNGEPVEIVITGPDDATDEQIQAFTAGLSENEIQNLLTHQTQPEREFAYADLGPGPTDTSVRPFPEDALGLQHGAIGRGLVEGASLGLMGHAAGATGLARRNLMQRAGIKDADLPEVGHPGGGLMGLIREPPKNVDATERAWEIYNEERDRWKQPIKDSPITGTLAEMGGAFFGGYPLATAGRALFKNFPYVNIPKKGAVNKFVKAVAESPRKTPRFVQDTSLGALEGGIAASLMGDTDYMGTNFGAGAALGGVAGLASRPIQDFGGRLLTLYQPAKSRAAQIMRDALRFHAKGRHKPPTDAEDAKIVDDVLKRDNQIFPPEHYKDFPGGEQDIRVLSTTGINTQRPAMPLFAGSDRALIDESQELKSMFHDAMAYPGRGREIAWKRMEARQADQGKRFIESFPQTFESSAVDPKIRRKIYAETRKARRGTGPFVDVYRQGKNFNNLQDTQQITAAVSLAKPSASKNVTESDEFIRSNVFMEGVKDKMEDLAEGKPLKKDLLQAFDSPRGERNLRAVYGDDFVDSEKTMRDSFEELRKSRGSAIYRQEPSRDDIGFSAARQIFYPNQYSRAALAWAWLKGQRQEKQRRTFNRVAEMMTTRNPTFRKDALALDDNRKLILEIPDRPLESKIMNLLRGEDIQDMTLVDRFGNRRDIKFDRSRPHTVFEGPGLSQITLGKPVRPGSFDTPEGYSGTPLSNFIPPSETLYRHSSGGAAGLLNPIYADSQADIAPYVEAAGRVLLPMAIRRRLGLAGSLGYDALRSGE